MLDRENSLLTLVELLDSGPGRKLFVARASMHWWFRRAHSEQTDGLRHVRCCSRLKAQGRKRLRVETLGA